MRPTTRLEEPRDHRASRARRKVQGNQGAAAGRAAVKCLKQLYGDARGEGKRGRRPRIARTGLPHRQRQTPQEVVTCSRPPATAGRTLHACRRSADLRGGEEGKGRGHDPSREEDAAGAGWGAGSGRACRRALRGARWPRASKPSGQNSDPACGLVADSSGTPGDPWRRVLPPKVPRQCPGVAQLTGVWQSLAQKGMKGFGLLEPLLRVLQVEVVQGRCAEDAGGEARGPSLLLASPWPRSSACPGADQLLARFSLGIFFFKVAEIWKEEC